MSPLNWLWLLGHAFSNYIPVSGLHSSMELRWRTADEHGAQARKTRRKSWTENGKRFRTLFLRGSRWENRDQKLINKPDINTVQTENSFYSFFIRRFGMTRYEPAKVSRIFLQRWILITVPMDSLCCQLVDQLCETPDMSQKSQMFCKLLKETGLLYSFLFFFVVHPKKLPYSIAYIEKEWRLFLSTWEVLFKNAVRSNKDNNNIEFASSPISKSSEDYSLNPV